MKFCVSTDVGAWTNWSTFEPDPDHRPDAWTGKSESRRSVEVGQTSTSLRLQVTGCTAERYCLLHVVVTPRTREFPGSGWFFCTMYGCGATGRQTWLNFRILAFVGGTRAPPSALLVCVVTVYLVSGSRWNSLDQDTVDAPSLDCFKNRLNKIRSTRIGSVV